MSGIGPVRPRPGRNRSQNYDESDEEEAGEGAAVPMELDDNFKPDLEPEYTAMKELPPQPRIYVANTTPVGGLAYCADCRKRFSVTAYT